MSLQILQLEMAEIQDQSFKVAGYYGKVKYDQPEPTLKLYGLSFSSNRFSFTNQTMHRKCYRFSFIVANAPL